MLCHFFIRANFIIWRHFQSPSANFLNAVGWTFKKFRQCFWKKLRQFLDLWKKKIKASQKKLVRQFSFRLADFWNRPKFFILSNVFPRYFQGNTSWRNFWSHFLPFFQNVSNFNPRQTVINLTSILNSIYFVRSKEKGMVQSGVRYQEPSTGNRVFSQQNNEKNGTFTFNLFYSNWFNLAVGLWTQCNVFFRTCKQYFQTITTT